MRRAQALLVSVFLAGLALQVLFIGALSFEHALRETGFRQLFLTLLSVYSVPFAVIVAGVFGGQLSRPSKRYSGFPFGIAITLTVLWNLLLCGRTVMFALSGGPWRVVDRDLHEISTSASFLVAGALTFFFTHRASESGPPRPRSPEVGGNG